MEAKNRGQVNGSRCLILCTLIMTWWMQGQPQLHRIVYTLCEDRMSCRDSIMSYLALFVKSTPDSLQSFHFIYCRHLCFMKAIPFSGNHGNRLWHPYSYLIPKVTFSRLIGWIGKTGLIRANVLINYKDRSVLDFSRDKCFLSCAVLSAVLE